MAVGRRDARTVVVHRFALMDVRNISARNVGDLVYVFMGDRKRYVRYVVDQLFVCTDGNGAFAKNVAGPPSVAIGDLRINVWNARRKKLSYLQVEI
jgi:hypothetical protein